FLFFFHCSVAHPDLHSFPTRRSSDLVVWDVGHQTYAHKILTGRRDGMSRLRMLGGISGFPQRGESAYDTFGTAHSSTSISAALRSEEHTSELQSRENLVCRLLLEKKK